MNGPAVPPRHLVAAVAATLLTSVFYSFPRAAALAMSTAAPWAILVSGAAALLMFWPVAATLAGRPGKNLIDLSLSAGGRPLAILTALLLGAFFLASAGISVRQNSEMVVTALYPNTPQTFAMSALVAMGALGAAGSPGGLLWMGFLFAGPTLTSILLLLLGNTGWGQLRNLYPMTGHGLLPVAAETLPLTSYFDPLIYMAAFCGYLKSARQLVRGAVLAGAVAVAVWALVILFYLMIFPLPGGLDVPFPLFELSRLVQGGRHLERLDAIWIIFWTFGSAYRLALSVMATSLLFKDAFRLPDHRGAVLPLTMAVLAMALLPSNQATAIVIETNSLRRWGFLIALGLPLLITLAARLRERRRHKQRTGGSVNA